MKKILIVEDDENLSRGIAFVFAQDGFDVVTADTLAEAARIAAAESPHLIILDIGLPDGNGVDFCRQIRESSDVPVIMLTARDLETDEVSGLMAGADDYVTKPFSLFVLRARVETALRRAETSDTHIIKSGRFTLDTHLCKFYRDSTEIPISATEFRLINLFVKNAGQILSKEQILSLWDMQGMFVDENTLSVNISRLRAKLEDDPRQPKVIKTIHGMGYIWIASR